MSHPESRRDRMRVQTRQEILTIALEQLSSDGAGAISLRGIARRMGMTAGAIYGYFGTRDDLVTAIRTHINISLATALDDACLRVGGDPRDRLIAWGTAFREWSLSNRAGFKLIYGEPIPGYAAPTNDPAAESARTICSGLNRLVWELVGDIDDDPQAPGWTDFAEAYASSIRTDVPGMSPATAALALRVWGRMHGLVSLEVYGHLAGLYGDPEALHRRELAAIVEQLAPLSTPS